MSLVEKAGAATTGGSTEGTTAATTSSTEGAGAGSGSAEWYYDENIKGVGDKPDWLISKFKSAGEQARGYAEIEKKLGAFKGAPETYDLTLSNYPDVKLTADDPIIAGFIEGAKKNGVSQEYVSELLNVYADALTANIPDVDAELEKLGPNGKQDVQILTQWANSNFTESEFNMFTKMLTTADAVRFFEKVRNLSTSSDVSPTTGASHVRETEADVRNMVSDPRYEKDENFRAEVRRRMAAALGVKK